MKLAAAVLSLVLTVPGLAQSQTLAPPRLLYPGESPPSVPPPTPTPGSWPAADGSDVGLNSPGCGARSTYTGPSTITANNTTIANVNFNGLLRIAADNVTISCSDLSDTGGTYGVLVDGSGYGDSIATNFHITKSRVHDVATAKELAYRNNGKGMYITGYSSGTVADYNEFTQSEDGIHSEGSNVLIEHNWIHDLLNSVPGGPSIHCDALAVSSGNNVMIRNNRFGLFLNNSLSAIMVQPAGGTGTPNNIDIVSNYIDGSPIVGSNVVLLDHQDPPPGVNFCPTGMDLLNNQFGVYGGTAFNYGSGIKSCTPVSQRGGSCSGNKRIDGTPVGC